MLKRFIALVLCLCFCVCFGCKKTEESDAPLVSADTETSTEVGTLPYSGSLVGFVLEDDGSLPSYMSMHGFLRTAENLCLSAKLYRAKDGLAAEEAVRKAHEEGCDAILIQNRSGSNNKAVSLAVSLGMKTAVPYTRCSVSGLDVNVVADEGEYIEDLVRGLAKRLEERGLRSGRILVYGEAADVEACYPQFLAAIQSDYPQYSLEAYPKYGSDEAAKEELIQYLLYNRDIKGMYVATSALAELAVEARNRASRLFRANGTPSPTPSPTPDPLAGEGMPLATPNPGLLTQISITIFATGISDTNLALFNDNDIYALCIEPYYEASAQALMLLDRLLRGEDASNASRVNRPIVYADTIDRYLAIYEQAKEMFDF